MTVHRMFTDGEAEGSVQQGLRETPRPALRDARGRFAPVHGAYSARQRLRQGDRRYSLVKQAEALRDTIAAHKGYAGWSQCPEPLRGMIELAAEVRIYRRLLARPLWKRQAPPTRYTGVSELERRVLVALGTESAAVQDPVAVLRERYAAPVASGDASGEGRG